MGSGAPDAAAENPWDTPTEPDVLAPPWPPPPDDDPFVTLGLLDDLI